MIATETSFTEIELIIEEKGLLGLNLSIITLLSSVN